MAENQNDLRERTTEFALRIVRMYTKLPKTTEAQTLGRQVLRSGTSVGAQFRESQRAKSDADFINKLEGCLQEADETAYWLELLVRSEIVPADKFEFLRKETDEIIAILVTIVTKVKKRIGKL
ncbi:MAG: four helix bundle protein [Anaerolineales bacterium]|uniref:four helix bundle protein n=1 Tax=Candidatus Villigracilis proximus TaxID=3140683 RepID=UPI0031376D73|nr:four helix bundle protein [Anaerolineales bacterium]